MNKVEDDLCAIWYEIAPDLFIRSLTARALPRALPRLLGSIDAARRAGRRTARRPTAAKCTPDAPTAAIVQMTASGAGKAHTVRRRRATRVQLTAAGAGKVHTDVARGQRVSSCRQTGGRNRTDGSFSDAGERTGVAYATCSASARPKTGHALRTRASLSN